MVTSQNFIGSGFCICPVCCQRHAESGLHLVSAESFLGWALCGSCEALSALGFVACIEVVEFPPGDTGDEQVVNAKRTGMVYYVQRAGWGDYFDFTIAPDDRMIFVDPACGADLSVLTGSMRPTVH